MHLIQNYASMQKQRKCLFHDVMHCKCVGGAAHMRAQMMQYMMVTMHML